ncbi:hypothetical protein ACIL82_02095 [Enterococcus faecium]
MGPKRRLSKEVHRCQKVAEFNGNESAVQMILEDLAKDDTK